MADIPKKFTFGFSKVVKKSNLVAPLVIKQETNNIQLIDCLEANTIKLKNGEEKKEEAPLIIPIIGPRKSSTIPNGKSIAEIVEDFSDVGPEAPNLKQNVQDDIGPPDSLEAMAAREILKEGADALMEAPTSTLESLPSVEDKTELQRESTLDDYESIPVTQFGLAMLRGMGWKPDEGIGKNKKLVPVTAPMVRPKGMGLGADKMLLAAAAKKATNTSTKDEDELKMVKGAYVKVAAGMHKDHYAQVEGFSDDSGRVLLKMAIGGNVVSVNEATVYLVSKTEYSKNSKVLNAAKYDEFKKKEETGSNLSVSPKRTDSKKSSSRSQSDRYKSPDRRRESPPDRQKVPSSRRSSPSTSPDRQSKSRSTRSRSPKSKTKGRKSKRSHSRTPSRRRR